MLLSNLRMTFPVLGHHYLGTLRVIIQSGHVGEVGVSTILKRRLKTSKVRYLLRRKAEGSK